MSQIYYKYITNITFLQPVYSTTWLLYFSRTIFALFVTDLRFVTAFVWTNPDCTFYFLSSHFVWYFPLYVQCTVPPQIVWSPLTTRICRSLHLTTHHQNLTNFVLFLRVCAFRAVLYISVAAISSLPSKLGTLCALQYSDDEHCHKLCNPPLHNTLTLNVCILHYFASS